MSGCLIVIFIGGLLFLMGIGWLYFYGKSFFADRARDALVEMIEDSSIPLDEQASMIEQIDRLTDSFKSGDIGPVQLTEIIADIASSPVMAVIVVFAVETRYIISSGLNDAEREAAKVTLQRLARGVIEKQISEEQLERVLEPVTHRTNDDQVLKESITDDDLREFLLRAEALADEAGVSKEPIEVHLGDALKEAIDRALERSEREQSTSTAPIHPRLAA